MSTQTPQNLPKTTRNPLYAGQAILAPKISTSKYVSRPLKRRIRLAFALLDKRTAIGYR